MHPHDRLRLVAALYVVLSSGEVRGPNGLRALNKNADGYLRFGHLFKDGVRTVMVHRLVAYQKFGEALFAPGIVTRHLDGNPANNSDSNIGIGSQSENMMDAPKEARDEKAKAAARHRRRFSETEVAQIRSEKAAGSTLKMLASKYGVQKSTLSYIIRGVTYPPPSQ